MAIKLFFLLVVAVLMVAATQAANPRFRAITYGNVYHGHPCEKKHIGTNCQEHMVRKRGCAWRKGESE